MNRQRKKKKQEEGISAKKEAITLGNALLRKETHIELSGNYEALVEGCKGIVEYNDTLIRVNSDNGQLKFTGRNLQIACMSDDSMIIRGYIVGVEYCN